MECLESSTAKPEKWKRENSENVKQAHQHSQTVPKSETVLVDETLPVHRHQESGRLDHEECVIRLIESLFAGRRMATNRCNLAEGVVRLIMKRDTHQKRNLRSNSTGATFIKRAQPDETHNGDTLCTAPLRNLICKKMPQPLCQNSFDVCPSEGPVPTKAQSDLRSVTLVIPTERADTGTGPENFIASTTCLLLDEALEGNSSDRPLSLLLDQSLICIAYHKVHVIVEAKDSALCSHAVVLVEPSLHTISLPEVVEDLVDV